MTHGRELVEQAVECSPARSGASGYERSRRAAAGWGQAPAEEYTLGAWPRGGFAPAVRGRRENEILDVLLEHADRVWLERGPEWMWVCGRSKRTGRVFRYRCALRSSLVRWVQWSLGQERLRRTRFERCSCAAREERCPLCQEARLGVEDPMADSEDAEFVPSTRGV